MTGVRRAGENASISLNELSDHVGGGSCTPTDLFVYDTTNERDS